MGFQQPPSLPDYSKLTFMLNSSGVQKWNPAIYDIMKALIAAVQQSQDVVTNNIENIDNSSSGLTSVSVDAAGALSGDGTPGSPLAVKVDGATITIVGDQLVGATPAGVILTKSTTIVDAAVLTANTVPIQLLASPGAGLYYEVLFGILKFHMNGVRNWNSSNQANLFYGAGTVPVWNFGQFAAITNTSYIDMATKVAALFTSAAVQPDNSALFLKASGNTTATGAGTNSCVVDIGYLIRAMP